MIRRLATAMVGVMAFMIFLAEIQRMDDEAVDRTEQQRNFNAPQ